MAKKRDIYENGKRKYSYEELEAMFNKQRVKVLAKYVDKHFTSNPEFIDKIEWFMNGNIKNEIIEALDKEFDILRDDPNDVLIEKMLNEKVEKFIQELYP